MGGVEATDNSLKEATDPGFEDTTDLDNVGIIDGELPTVFSKFKVCFIDVFPVPPNLGVATSFILRELSNSLLLGDGVDLDNAGSGFNFVNPFLCKNCLNAVSFSGENP